MEDRHHEHEASDGAHSQPSADADYGPNEIRLGRRRSKGAYVLADAPGGDPEIIFMGTGTELQLCVAAHEQLTSEGVRSRVVSMPCWELFERQSPEYRESVLPNAVRARVACEAGTTLGWREFVGLDGRIVARREFGASAPLSVLLKEFGFTAEAVAQHGRELLGRA